MELFPDSLPPMATEERAARHTSAGKASISGKPFQTDSFSRKICRMNTTVDFDTVVCELLNLCGLDGRLETMVRQELYVITLDGKLDINLLGKQKGYLNLICVAGKLPKEAGKQALSALLQADLFHHDRPVVSIGLDAATKEVVLWSSLALAGVTVDAAAALLRRIGATGMALQKWLSEGAPATGSLNTQSMQNKDFSYSTAHRLASFQRKA